MTLTAHGIAELRARVAGPVLLPGDEGFADEVSGFNAAHQHAPDVAIAVTSDGDVQEAVRFAAEHGLPVRIQSTGHGSLRPILGGMLISTTRLRELSIDPESRLATIGAGVCWQEVLDRAAEHGLTAITGSSPTVGAVGLCLGGGIGPLGRSHGYSSDYVRGFTVVTADGERVEANAGEHSELFWALRGGKVGLGVVTRMTLELVPLASVCAGALYFDTPYIEQVLRGWIDWTATAPAEVTTSVAIMNLPDMEMLPPPLRGRHTICLRFAYPGDAAEGARLAEPLRALAPALLDSIDTLPTAAVGAIHSDPPGPLPVWDTGRLLHSVDQDFATAVLDRVGPGSRLPLLLTEIRHWGGALKTDVAGGSATGGRLCDFTFYIVGAPAPQLFETVLPAVAAELFAAVEPWVSEHSYVNFLGCHDADEAILNAWPPGIRERLTAARQHYDPAGLFAYGAA